MQIHRTQIENDDRRAADTLRTLRLGCCLVWFKPAGRYFIDTGGALTGPSLSPRLVRELEQEGVLRHDGSGRYALADSSC